MQIDRLHSTRTNLLVFGYWYKKLNRNQFDKRCTHNNCIIILQFKVKKPFEFVKNIKKTTFV